MTYYCDIRLSNSRDGGFWVSFPDIKGVYSMGDNKEHTLAMAKKALEGTLEVYLEIKFHIPSPVNRSDEGLFPI